MTDDLAEQLAGLQRAMAAPLPDPEVLAAGTAEDRAMADRIHKVRPGVPLHHVFAVLEALRVVQRVDAAKVAPDSPEPRAEPRTHQCPVGGLKSDGSTHIYFSTGCRHGDMVLPGGRTGHEYCQGETGAVGAKTPAVCKFCAALCQCGCHDGERCSTCGTLVEPLGMVLHHRAVHATAEQLAEDAPASAASPATGGEQW